MGGNNALDPARMKFPVQVPKQLSSSSDINKLKTSLAGPPKPKLKVKEWRTCLYSNMETAITFYPQNKLKKEILK